ncbi:heavy metal translocating P-type ATPase [Arthrobacter globiformis]|uniref:heavy metal translocating P-type ATPase n=1 Tax=Arthrobacter globiformis TaxID=1665 RepID=UPI00209C0EEA|nr:heavy metal translocating P-type ATPase [Arthrobacter globiformis]
MMRHGPDWSRASGVHVPVRRSLSTGTLRRGSLLVTALLAGACTAILVTVGQEGIAQLAASLYALAAAAIRSVTMVKEIVHGRWGVDLLAVIAIVSTVAVGEYAASLIIVLMLAGGEALEDYAEGRAVHELRALLERAPRQAHREGAGGGLEDIPVAEVRPGDVLVVRPSEVVPVDGKLLSDAGVFDESALTGESLPADHEAGDMVLSGSVNGEAAVRVRASATAAHSQYSRILVMVQEAAASRAPVARLADRYAVPFTALAFLLAGAGWYLSQDPGRFAQVLVVATPCPLLLAAPVAFLAGTSRAAHSGIIVKNGGTLERLARVRTAVFDKTGTLTKGKPTLKQVKVAPAAHLTPSRLLQLAASAEQYSSHVLSGSVIDAARVQNISLVPGHRATEHATQGVTAVCDGHTVAVGKPAFIKSATSGFAETGLDAGELAVYVGVDGRFCGVLIMSDPLRDNAVDTLRRLRGLGVRETLLLTGDSRSTARHIAAEAGISRVRAECLPADKVREVTALFGRPVMMVGDGVNDAPVLAAADVGVAMGAKGSTAASESADVVIMVDDLSRVALALEIGRRTTQTALQSIWVGIGLSIVLMVFAAAGFIPAVAGALLQELVDLATILNALRALKPGRGTAARKEDAGTRPAGVRQGQPL